MEMIGITASFHTFSARLVCLVLLATMLATTPFRAAFAQIAPPLGTAQSFAVLGSSTVTNTGPTVITGDLGVSPGTAVTGFPPGIVTGGTIHAADAVAAEAQANNTTAYNELAGQACNFNYTGEDLGGKTLVPGVYCFSSSAQLTGTLTLDAGGDANAVWVFQIGSTLTTASASSVVIINGGQPCNVFWQIGSSATLGTNTTFIGNILALTSITLTTDVKVSGRALAQNGAVTMDSNTVSLSTCGVPPVTPVPPTLGKAFSPATIAPGGVSTLTITLSNPDASVATLSSLLVDTLPTGVVTNSTPTNTCGGTATASASSVTLTGGSIPANGSCTVTVSVTAALGGSYLNSIAIGALQTSNGANSAPAVATLTVPQSPVAPTVGKSFTPATITAGGSSTVTITLGNASHTVATLTAPLVDTLPSGLVITSTPITTCGGTATAGTSSVTLTGGSIPAEGACTVTVSVTAAVGGSYFNSLAIGALHTSNGTNAGPAVATLTVNTPASGTVSLSKSFSPATVIAGGDSTLTITLSNSTASVASLTAALVDTFPGGLTPAGTPTTTCGGTATAGASSVTLTGGSIPADGSCTVTVSVTAATGGNYLNSLAAGALKTSQGNNTAPAIATLSVTTPSVITLSKTFSPATISAGGVSTLTITLNNPNSTATALTAPLTDHLPTGVVVASTPNASTTCGGIGTATPGSSEVSLTAGEIPANGSCTATVSVTAAVPGSYFNSIPAGALQTGNGSNASPAIATLTVLQSVNVAPILKKSFSPASISVGAVSVLTITLTNSGSTIATLTAPLVDHLPSGVVVAGTGSSGSGSWGSGSSGSGSWGSGSSGSGSWTGSACGGTVTASGSTVTLAGGWIPANGSCTVSVNVTANSKGSYTNTIPAGALQANCGKNTTPATAVLTVNGGSGPLKLGKAFSPTTINAGGVSTLTITLTNPNSSAVTLTTPLTDNFPSGMVVGSGQGGGNNNGGNNGWSNSSVGNTGWGNNGGGQNGSDTCGGTLTATNGSTRVTLTGGSIPANGSCTVTVQVTVANQGSYTNRLPGGSLQTNGGSCGVEADATLNVTNGSGNAW
jgi:Ice-binding-like